MAKKKKKRIEEYFAGGLLTAGISTVGTLVNNQKQKEAEIEAQNKLFQDTLADRKIRDEGILDSYAVEGSNASALYAKGGNMNANKIPSKNNKPLSSDAKKIVGAGTHESGNDVPVIDENGNVKAKVENEEVILDGDKVLSERSGHADVAEGISSAKGALEKVLGEGNKKNLSNLEKNTNSRVLSPLKKAIADLDKANDDNFRTQELAKGNNTIDMTGGNAELALGGYTDRAKLDPSLYEDPIKNKPLDFELAKTNPDAITSRVGTGDATSSNIDFANNIAPYLDNVASLLQRTPKVPAPIRQEAASLDTNVDVTQRLQDIANEEQAGLKDIDQNTSSSNVALARKSALRSGTRSAKARVLSDKDTAEAQLRNQNVINRQQVQAENTRAQNEFAASNLNRNVAQNEKLLANVSNLVGDIRQASIDDALQAKDQRAALAIVSQNAGSGAHYQMVLNGSFDFLDAAGKQTIIRSLKAAGRDTAPIEARWAN